MLLALPTLALLYGLAAPAGGEARVTYSKDVAPILWKRCVGCHRPGEAGPFSLLTYKDAAKRAKFLKELVLERRMPPWKPEPGFGEFEGPRRLDDREIALIGRWADQGAAEGGPNELPAPPTFPEGWRLGPPDLILKMPEPFVVPAAGPDVVRCFVVPIGAIETRMVEAVEFRPGNSKVVRRALFFLDGNGAGRARDRADPGPGYSSFGGVKLTPTGSLGGWAPGTVPRRRPDGVGMLLSKGSDLILQIHYKPSGKPESDQSTLGVTFAKGPVSDTKIVAGLRIVNFNLDLPAGASRRKVTARSTVPTDVHAIGITPHMHWLGQEMTVTATLPNGTVTPLIRIKEWDFNWQDEYQYARPVALPRGTRLDLEAYYDNSSANPRNPNSPPKDVRFGERPGDEMCLCTVQAVADHPGGYEEIRASFGLRSAGTSPGR